MRKLLFLTLLCLSQNLVADADSPKKRALTLDDQFAFKDVSSPVLSPDGKQIAYTVTTKDIEEEDSPSRIWMRSLPGGDSVVMTSKSSSAWSPRFSKDGTMLYFLSDRGEHTQVWALDLVHGGDAHQVTELERSADVINFSPDEKNLLFVFKDKKPEEESADKDKKSKAPKPWVIDRLQFKEDYIGYLDSRRTHIYLYEVESKKLTQITSGDYDDSEPAWSPDGDRVAFVSNRSNSPDSNNNSDIWIVEAKNEDKGLGLRKVTDHAGADSSPVWHPDGTQIAYLSTNVTKSEDYATSHLAVANLEGLSREVLSEDVDRNMSSLEFAESGNKLLFLIEDSGENHIGQITWQDKKLSRLTTGPISVADFSSARSGLLACVVSKDSEPGDIFVPDLDAKDGLRRITNINGALLSQIRMGETEEIHFKSHDGLEIEGFVTKPPGFEQNKRYPSVVLIHGGPVGQFSHEFSFEAQFLAANGYLVVRCNPRGSSGYGQDFCIALDGGWGEKDYRDILAAADHVIDLGWADPDRLGVGGYSYGGILTNYIIGQTKRFKAAVSGAGSGLYTANYGHDMYQRLYVRELGLPWENRELWERLSPFNHIHKATTPTLFLCGEKDWNVPVQNCEQLYQAMRQLGVPTRLVVYPGEHHGGWSFANTRDYNERQLAWFSRYLKDSPKQASLGER